MDLIFRLQLSRQQVEAASSKRIKRQLVDHGNGEIELNANYILFIRNVFPACVNMPCLNFANKADYLQCSPTARYNVNEGFDPRLMRHCIVNDMGTGEDKWEQFLAVAKSDYDDYDEKLNDKQSMENSRINPDSYSYNQLLKSLCKAKQIEKAYKLFANMMEMEGLCDMVSCNLLIDGLYRPSKTSIAHKLSKGMILKGIQPDTVTYGTLINGFLMAGNAEFAEELFDQMFKVGIVPNANAYCIMVHHYCKTGRIGLACSYFHDIIKGGISPDVVSYSALVNGLLRAHRVNEAMALYEDMCNRGVIPDDVTYKLLIGGLLMEDKVALAHMIWDDMMEKGFTLDKTISERLIEVTKLKESSTNDHKEAFSRSKVDLRKSKQLYDKQGS